MQYSKNSKEQYCVNWTERLKKHSTNDQLYAMNAIQ